jgi:phosphonate transport system substrate-binding protein
MSTDQNSGHRRIGPRWQQRLVLWLAAAACLPALQPARADEGVTTLRLATYSSERPSAELAKMEPIRAAIERGLNAGGNRFRVEMRIFNTYGEAVDAAVSGTADFSRLGPASYVLAKARQPGLPLLARESIGRSGQLNGYIFVADQSPIREIKDLRGRRFAFGEEQSTTGRYLAQAALVDAGIHARDLAEYKYLGRHDKVAFAVGAESFDAGAANEITLRKYREDKRLRPILFLSGPAHAWVGRRDLPRDRQEALRQALLSLQPAELERIGRDAILTAEDSDFDAVRSAMKKSERFFE